jgi:hypothetical protein
MTCPVLPEELLRAAFAPLVRRDWSTLRSRSVNVTHAPPAIPASTPRIAASSALTDRDVGVATAFMVITPCDAVNSSRSPALMPASRRTLCGTTSSVLGRRTRIMGVGRDFTLWSSHLHRSAQPDGTTGANAWRYGFSTLGMPRPRYLSVLLLQAVLAPGTLQRWTSSIDPKGACIPRSEPALLNNTTLQTATITQGRAKVGSARGWPPIGRRTTAEYISVAGLAPHGRSQACAFGARRWAAGCAAVARTDQACKTPIEKQGVKAG